METLNCIFLENLLVVGSQTHRTTELLSLNKWQWNINDPYPNIKDRNPLKIIPYNRTFYVFEGYVQNQVSNIILGFEGETWSQVGSLFSKRKKFSVILNLDKVYVIGGQNKQKHELCTLSNTVSCEQVLNINFQGSEEPVLIGVSKDDSCDLTIPNYAPKESKELMILSNATFKEVESFVSVQKTDFRSDKYSF